MKSAVAPVVSVDSARVSRVPAYSGGRQGRSRHFVYRAITFCGASFHPLRLYLDFVTPRPARRRNKTAPTTLTGQRLRS